MKFSKRAKISLFSNNNGSVFFKTLLLLCTMIILLGAAMHVFAADADGDNFDDTTPNATHPRDCDDLTAGTRPLMNNSNNFIYGNISVLKICSGGTYVYENSLIIINSSSNASLNIACSGNNTGNTTGHGANFTINATGGNASLRNWIHINGTNSVVTIENCTLIGIGDTNQTAAETNETLAVNITNSSNVVINNFQVRDTNFGGVHIAGDSNNITIMNSEFSNITGNTSGAANQGNNLHDVIWAKNGANINISFVNITIAGATNVNVSAGAGINISTNRVVLYSNRFSHNSVLANIRSNGTGHYIANNSFGNATTGLWLANSTNHTILENNFTSSGFTTNTTNALLFLTGVFNATATNNVLANTTNGGWCVHVEQGGRNTLVDNEIANCTGDVLMNMTGDSEMRNNNMTFATNWLLLANNSFNLSLKNNTWTNSTAVGLEFINGSNTTLKGEHVYNVSMKGIIFNQSNDINLHNVSVSTFNSSAADYALDRVLNATLDGFNSTRAGLHGLLIFNTSRVNMSNFNIINATHNALQIINSTNITSDYDNVTLSNINGTSNVLINVSTNSSFVNLSTLWLAGQGWPGLSPSGFGIYVNGSSFISFHNITVK
ncbi:MAG: right-handed parallel beta-helix repeat-containing protein, partial [Candidatus Woesearchaeota archaeon]|nr:right-handed parallel beta-helix repeat-containing protein [Candidatus Woesearchaeota archaeon]